MNARRCREDSTDLIGKALLSQNLLKLYETYISLEDLQVLIKAQTDDKQTWGTQLPSSDQAAKFNKDMLDKLVADSKWKKNINDGIVANTSTAIAPNKNFGSRIDAQNHHGETVCQTRYVLILFLFAPTLMNGSGGNSFGIPAQAPTWKMSVAEVRKGFILPFCTGS